jgi:hypothetical protein
MATFTWTAPGTSGNWDLTANWGGTGIPGASSSGVDVATVPAGTGKQGQYTVTVTTGTTFDLATLNVASGTGSHKTSLGITGSLLTNSLSYSSGNAVPISISAGGLFDIRNSISAPTTETITIADDGAGGHLELGSATITDTDVTFAFGTNGSGIDHGVIEYLSGFNPGGTTVSQKISNLGWGDSIVFDGANFTGDTFTYDSGTQTLTVKSGVTPVLTMNNVSVAAGVTSASFVANGDKIGVVCFAAGTRILTDTGERLVESLMQGDIVLSLDDGKLNACPVKWLGRRRIDLTAHPHPETVAPVRIRRGAFADNMPHTDLLVSPDHAIFVDGRLIVARQLINGTTIYQEKNWTSVEYFHVALDSHAILLAEGLPAESYLNTGNRGFFANSGEPLVLHPDLTDESDYPTREAGSCAPFVSDEASVRPVWQRLSERAAALGHPAPAVATTTAPELHLVVARRKIRPIYGENGLFIFALPRNAEAVRLVSRAAAPTEARPWLDDRRRLGVQVARIVLRATNDVREVPVDHPDLGDGWWPVERDGMAIRRWTDGVALLPLPAIERPTMLELHLGGTMTYVTSNEDGRQAA